MLILSIFCLLGGIALAQRFKVLVLIPAALPAILLALVIGIKGAYAPLSVALFALAALACLQLGYVAGAVLHLLPGIIRSSQSQGRRYTRRVVH
jgi:hypothetical protein